MFPWNVILGMPHISLAAHGNPLKGSIMSNFVHGLKGYKKATFMT